MSRVRAAFLCVLRNKNYTSDTPQLGEQRKAAESHTQEHTLRQRVNQRYGQGINRQWLGKSTPNHHMRMLKCQSAGSITSCFACYTCGQS
ncbi:hypothetical protein NQZ68_016130 [Dissostichus eleginoides]|nr:hypothetical protein NQZ68_016130 [Dissostichus eleginoides]